MAKHCFGYNHRRFFVSIDMGYKTFKFKMYDNAKRNAFLQARIQAFASLYNHFVALRRRYYRMFKKSPNKNDLINHVAKLKKTERFAWWNTLPSQALQNVVERIDFGYNLFFLGQNKRLPKFRSCFKYKSYTLKQTGYEFLEGNRILLAFGIRGRVKRVFKYFKHREFDVESVKTVTVMRDRVGDIWLCITALFDSDPKVVFKTGKTAGFDFGLKHYLTVSDGTVHKSPLFFKRGIRKVKNAHRDLSRKQKHSNSRVRARQHLARTHRKVATARENYHWQLANELVKKYDVLCFETLNLQGMKKLWGRKVSDLGFADFLTKLQWVARKHGKDVVFIDNAN